MQLPSGAYRSYRDLRVWQRAIQLTTAIYRCTETFAREELYGLTSQLRRAAVSIPSNIAEGKGRNTLREYRHFLAIARGSNMEVQTQLVIARELQFGSLEKLAAAEALSEEIGSMLAVMLRRLDSSPG